MTDIEILTKNKKINTGGIISFGFLEREKDYIYSVELINGQLEMTVIISKKGKMSAEIKDTASKEVYVLHKISDSQGIFVGKVRDEYNRILNAVIDACFERDIFKSEYSKQIINYVRKKYNDELQFLWAKFPNNAIFRRQDTKKWYAALLILEKRKLGLKEEGIVEIIDLRIKPENLAELIDNQMYFPGYHMNKKHWFTICLDGSVPLEEIFRHIDSSYILAV